MNNSTNEALSANESLQERTRRLLAMGQMAASLAHEIRNPLGSMELYCTLLKKDLVKQPEQQELAEHIHASIKRVNRIISNCLQFSKDFKPRDESIYSVKAFIEEAVDTLEHRLVDSAVTISVNVQGDKVKNVDRYLMAQVLTNLVSNAIEAVRERLTKEKNCEAKVIIESIVNDNGWTLAVRDSGVGISPESREKIFDPFFSTKTSGTGLGLAVVHAIVVAQHGNIAIESIPQQETKFTVTLPRAERV